MDTIIFDKNMPTEPGQVNEIHPAATCERRLADAQPGLHHPNEVRHLHQNLPSVTSRTLCGSVLEWFYTNPVLYSVPILDDNRVPIALIERHSFIEFFSQHFSNDLYGKKPLSQLGAKTHAIMRQPVVVDASTSIDDAATIVIEAGMQHMVSGFIVTADGKYLGIVNGHTLLNQITQRKQAELYQLAHFDHLTGIPNRMLFNDRLRMACLESDRKNTLVGMIYVDLDRFKQINDTMGHSFGDLLLKGVAQRLTSCVRGIDTVARLGGDEFAILMQNLATTMEAEITAKRVVDCFLHPFSILDREIYVTASLGIAIYPRDENDPNNLLTKADSAMYEAKQCGRNAFRSFSSDLKMQHSVDHMSLESDLRQAIARNELVLHYQPQVNTRSGNIVGVEALIRWQHPQRGLLSPSAFIGIAEESGMIIDIGQWVLSESCRQQRSWSLHNNISLRMAVNISSVQFRRNDFLDMVREVITESGADPQCIELELTENIAMHHASDVLKTLIELKQFGVKLSIDDFGTGFSSLSYLQRFPIDRLKIDQSFVRDIGNFPTNKSIIKTIVTLAHSMSLETIAEGVETETENVHTRMCQCDEVQGFYHARPMPAADLLAWIEKRGVQKQIVLDPGP